VNSLGFDTNKRWPGFSLSQTINILPRELPSVKNCPLTQFNEAVTATHYNNQAKRRLGMLCFILKGKKYVF